MFRLAARLPGGLGMRGFVMSDFSRIWISRFLISLGLLASAALAGIGAAGTASAQDRRQNAPGEFDFYVLSLSWSPSFCEAASERSNGGRSPAQCGGGARFFVGARG